MAMRSSTLSILGALLATTSPAHASCVEPAPLLLWSYPSEGDADVPPDAELWALTNLTAYAGRPEALLNGHPVAAASASPEPAQATMEQLLHGSQLRLSDVHIGQGPLAPRTDYTLTLVYPARAERPAVRFDVHFRTGERSRSPAPQVQVKHLSVDQEDPGQHPCRDVFAAQGCFDTIGARPNRSFAFALAPSAAIAWFVRNEHTQSSQLWPAVCGHPSLIVSEAEPNECFWLRPIGPGGRPGEEVRYCEGPPSARGHRPPEMKAVAARGLRPRAPVAAPAQATQASPPAPSPAPRLATPQPTSKVTEHGADGGCSVGGHGHDGPALAAMSLALWLARRRRPPLTPTRSWRAASSSRRTSRG
jgi:MYXO-CTERM domain-containing protein